MVGQIVGGEYEVVQLIGEGGMGAVYEARHTESGRRVAVKVIGDDAVARDAMLIARFEREAEAAAKVTSPHIVEILGSGHDPTSGRPFIVMELLCGENVHRLLKRLGPLRPALAVRIAVQTCAGLSEAHAAGVVHRDVKPANLFLSEGQDGERIVKLLDFGVAKFKMDQACESSGESLTRTGSLLGSPMYMAPEQARGLKTIDHRADIWSLGVVLFQLLTGKAPLSGIDGLGDLIISICAEEPPPLDGAAPWVPTELCEIVRRALRLDPAKRFQTAAEMGQALRACAREAAPWHLDTTMLLAMTPAEREARPSSGVPARHETTPGNVGAAGDGGSAGDGAATVALDDSEIEALDAAEPLPPPSSSAMPTVALAVEERALSPSDAAADDRAVLATTGPAARTDPEAVPEAARPARAEPAAASRNVWVAILAGVVLSAALVGIFELAGNRRNDGSAGDVHASATPSSALPEIGSAPIPRIGAKGSATAAAAAPPDDGAPAKLRVVPAFAGVVVDGQRAKIEDGTVAIQGAVGSTHVVIVTVGGKNQELTVRLTPNGPEPAEVVFSADRAVAAPGRAPVPARHEPYD